MDFGNAGGKNATPRSLRATVRCSFHRTVRRAGRHRLIQSVFEKLRRSLLVLLLDVFSLLETGHGHQEDRGTREAREVQSKGHTHTHTHTQGRSSPQADQVIQMS